MKPVLALSLALAASAMPTSDTISDLRKQIPSCALECIAEKSQELGCEVTDLTCQCKKLEALTKAVAPCLAKGSCTLAEMTDSATVSVKMCAVDMEENGYSIEGVSTTTSDRSASATDSADDDDSAVGKPTWSLVGVFAAAVLAAML